MARAYLRCGGSTRTLYDSLLSQAPPATACARIAVYLDKGDLAQIKMLLAELYKETGIQLPFTALARVALAGACSRLDAGIREKRLLKPQDIYKAILEPAPEK